MKIKIFYPQDNINAICEETYTLKEFIDNREEICIHLKDQSKDGWLDIQMVDADGYFVCQLDENGTVISC